MFTKDIGIDLGTSNVVIYEKGKGIVLDEPSVVAINRNSRKVVAVGEEAKRMEGRTPNNIMTIRPLKNGIIADSDITEAMLKHFLNTLGALGSYSKPHILICCPTDTSSVEQKAIRDAAKKTGAKSVYLEEELKAAAIGAGMEIFQPSGNMIVDIGGGTTDIAVLSMGSVVTATSIKVGGDTFDNEIISYVKRQYKLLIGERTAEEIKMKLGTISSDSESKSIHIRGRNMVSGLPCTITVYSGEIQEILEKFAYEILQATKRVIELTQPELSADFLDRGIILTGGGSLLHGMDKFLSEALQLPVGVAENPMHSVAVGTGLMLENAEGLSKIHKTKSKNAI